MNDGKTINMLVSMNNAFEIDDLDKRILQILVDHPGAKIKDIAAAVGRSEANISQRMKKPGFQKAQRELSATTDDLLLRAQKIAARRLLNLIKDKDSKIALDAIKIALAPHTNKRQVEQKTEIVFKTRIGSQGQLMQEVVDVTPSSHKQDISPNPEDPSSSSGETQDNQNDSTDK